MRRLRDFFEAPSTWIVGGVLFAVWQAGPGLVVAVLLGLVWGGSSGLRRADRSWRPDPSISALLRPDRGRRVTRHPVAPARRPPVDPFPGSWVYVLPYREGYARMPGEVAYVGFTERVAPQERWRDGGHPAQRADVDASLATVFRCPSKAEGKALEDELIDRYHADGHDLINVAGKG